MGLITKIHPSGRRVLRSKINTYIPPPKNAGQAARRNAAARREDYLQGREERRQDRKGGWGLISN